MNHIVGDQIPAPRGGGYTSGHRSYQLIQDERQGFGDLGVDRHGRIKLGLQQVQRRIRRNKGHIPHALGFFRGDLELGIHILVVVLRHRPWIKATLSSRAIAVMPHQHRHLRPHLKDAAHISSRRDVGGGLRVCHQQHRPHVRQEAKVLIGANAGGKIENHGVVAFHQLRCEALKEPQLASAAIFPPTGVGKHQVQSITIGQHEAGKGLAGIGVEFHRLQSILRNIENHCHIAQRVQIYEPRAKALPCQQQRHVQSGGGFTDSTFAGAYGETAFTKNGDQVGRNGGAHSHMHCIGTESECTIETAL